MSNIFAESRRREGETRVSVKVDRLKKDVHIDRSETCFAGKGTVCTESLTPSKLQADQLRRTTFW